MLKKIKENKIKKQKDKKIKKRKERKKADLLKIFANTYFVIQYLIVRFCLFGFKLQPGILDFYRAFHISDIILESLKFYKFFLDILNTPYYILWIAIFIPYFLRVLWACKYVILYAFAAFQLLQFAAAVISSSRYTRKINLDNVLIVKIGAPGAGKTSSGLYEAVVMAQRMWSELRFKHATYAGQVNKWRAENNAFKLAEWREIKLSYDYYKKKKCVPCLFTNIPVMVNGRFTSLVTKEHLNQEQCLPGYTVLFIDEVGSMLDVDMHKDRAEDASIVDLSNFFRLARHFGDFRIVCTEQDGANVFIDVRRVVAKNEYMLSQKWLLRPLILMLPFNIMRGIITRVGKCPRPLAVFMTKYRALIRSVGFRKYKYLTENNTERERGMETGKRGYCLPALLNFKYDDRTYRNLYKPKDQELQTVVFDSLVLEDEELYRNMILRKHKPKNKK